MGKYTRKTFIFGTRSKSMESCPHENCNYQTESYHGIKVHYAQSHDGSIAGEEYTCDECGTTFRRRPSAVNSEQVFCKKACKDVYQENKVSVNCDWCGDKLERIPSTVDGNNFCDMDCRDKHHTDNNTTLVECDECGDTVRKSNWRLRRSDNLFCSTKCQSDYFTGENNGAWVNDREHIEMRSSGEYYEWERNVFERDNHTCQDCGSTNELSAHHIERVSDSPEKMLDVSNGACLCYECHTERHKGERVYYAMKSQLVE